MPAQASYVFLMHGASEPGNYETYLADLLQRLDMERSEETRVAAYWDQDEISDQEFLAAANGEWGLPIARSRNFTTRILAFEDDSGESGRLLAAREN